MSRLRCPESNEQCKYYASEGGCYQNEHHLYWPRRDYTSSVERAFRQLPENKELICRAEHDELHATESPPPMPSRNEMLIVLANTAMKEAS